MNDVGRNYAIVIVSEGVRESEAENESKVIRNELFVSFEALLVFGQFKRRGLLF